MPQNTPSQSFLSDSNIFKIYGLQAVPWLEDQAYTSRSNHAAALSNISFRLFSTRIFFFPKAGEASNPAMELVF